MQISSNSENSKFNIDIAISSFLAFSLPLTNLAFQYIGLRFELQRIGLIICLIRLIVIFLTDNNHRTQFRKVFQILSPIFWLIGYAALVTLIQPSYIENISSVSIDKVYDFIWKRGLKFLSYIPLVIYLGIVLKSPRNIHTVFCSMMLGFALLEVLGLVQAGCFIVTGIDLFPLKRYIEEGGTTIIKDLSVPVNLMGVRLLRINSLSHEPKGLGVLISFFFIMKVFWRQYRTQFDYQVSSLLDNYLSKTILVSLLVLGLTFSSSGIIALILTFPLLFLSGFDRKINLKRLNLPFGKNIRLILIFATAIAILLFVFNTYSFAGFNSFLEQSLFRRTAALEKSINVEAIYQTVDPEDAVFLYNVLHYPTVLLHGLGFGAYSSISLSFFEKYYSHLSESPFARNIGIETIFSVGIPGLWLIRSLFCRINKLSIQGISSMSVLYRILNIIIISNFLIRSSEVMFFAVLGLLVAVSLVDLKVYQQKLSNDYY
jgi:hypothetical protein